MRLSDASSLRSETREATLARAWLDIEATRFALRRRRGPELVSAVRALFEALGSAVVRSELAHAAAAFAEGDEERPDAERWVYFAVSARATLEQASKSGLPTLARELESLDDAYEDVREAVLLLEPEDYLEALAGAPPNTGRWWGERARLDAGLKEIDLERALGEVADEQALDPSTPRPLAPFF